MIKRLCRELGEQVLENEPLAPYTTFKIGGPARYFFVARTTDELIRSVNLAKTLNLEYFILGGGSNVLVSDSGFDGLVIKSDAREIRLEDDRAFVDAGVTWGVLTVFAHKHGFTGIEELTHIPGTVGGAVRGNAGSMGKETKDVVTSVYILRNAQPEWILVQECEFAYRQSVFKKNNWVVLGAEIQLERGDVQKAQEKMREYHAYRQTTQPLSSPCPGCMFKNPDAGAGVYASKMIDELGLKGFQIGKARVSLKHANFIENLGGASAKEVDNLVAEIKKRVKEKYGYELEEEVIRLGP